ncbi:histidine phosphatase family protein [Gayadomonas joobiniege]|uniref:histidine phosphatase family protein n=1 Tax=Gayadomonas joobiniege TaxID=1234606 RepID=UPI0003779ED2|nr:alpha-ribazole phosphatase family protein [Gayadomonas joobiniege]
MQDIRTATFTFLRHGQVDGRAALYGQTNIELTDIGLAQMRQNIQLLQQIKPIDKVISSPLLRCALFAETFAEENDLEIVLDPRLSEMNFGRWDGIPFDRLQHHWNKLEAFWNNPYRLTPPGGESLKGFADRVDSAWQDLIKDNSGQHYLVVCHAGVIRVLLANILNLDLRNPSWFSQLKIDYASISQVSIALLNEAKPAVLCINTTLGALLATK